MKHTYLKKNYKYFILIFLALCICSLKITAQNVTTYSNKTKVKSTLWQPLFSNELVQINYKYATCNLPEAGTNNEYYYLQVVNKTNKKIQVEWLTEYWYNNKCIGCSISSNENVKLINLLPNEKKEGICSQSSNQALAIFSKMLAVNIKSELTDFNLKNIKVIIP